MHETASAPEKKSQWNYAIIIKEKFTNYIKYENINLHDTYFKDSE